MTHNDDRDDVAYRAGAATYYYLRTHGKTESQALAAAMRDVVRVLRKNERTTSDDDGVVHDNVRD